MAKKEKFSSGDFDLSSDLDFGDFDFGDPSSRKPTKDDRKPITKLASNVGKGAIGGLKSAATNRATIAKAIRAGMPKEYGEVLDRTGEATSEISSLYNDATTKIKPELQKIAKQVDKLVPAEMKRTKGFMDKIKKILGDGSSSRASLSAEEENEGNIQAQLAEVFAATAEDTVKTRAEDRAERKLNEKVEAKRFESSFGLLNSINVNMARMSNYNTKINSAYQKKSLELQYRSYFIQQDLLKSTKQLVALYDERSKDIVKNTGLPDFVKRTKADDFKDMARKKMIGGIQNGIGGFMKRLTGNLAKGARSKINDYAFTLQQAAMGLETAADMHESMKDMRAMGIGPSGPSEMIGDFLSQLGVDKAVGHIGNKIRAKTAKPGSKTSNFIFDLLSGMNNGERSLKNFRDKHLQENFDAKGFKQHALNKGKGLLGSLIDLGLMGGGGVGYEKHGGNLNDIHKAAEFNNLTQKSITTIIPGFLARIHHEVRSLRTGSEEGGLLEYDIRKGHFSTSGKIEKNTRNFLRNKVNSNASRYNMDSLYKHVTGGEKLSPEAEKALREKIHHHTFTGDGFDVSDLKHPSFTSGMSPEAAREVSKVIDKKFDSSDSAYSRNRAELTRLGRTAKGSIGNVDEEIQSLIAAGHADKLMKMGIIKPNGSGGYSQSKDALYKLSKEPTKRKFAESDFFSKQNIRGFSGKKALDAIKKSKVFKWAYKNGKGDGGEHVGPMAQDVRKHMGNDIAPGGKALDLTSMNGVNMAAIGELHDQMQKSGRQGNRGPQGQMGVLRAINMNTAAIVSRLDNMAHITLGIPKLDTKGLQEALKQKAAGLHNGFNTAVHHAAGLGHQVIDKAKNMKRPEGLMGSVANLASAAGDVFGQLFQKTISASKTAGTKLAAGGEKVGNMAKSAFNAGKDPVMNAGKWLFEKGTNLVGNVFDKVSETTTDIIQNKLPDGYKQVMQGLGWAGGKIKNIINPVTDIYVKGQTSPALKAVLIKAGGYFDQITSKPIKHQSDIKGPVVDHQGNVVLTVEDIEAGLIDGKGEAIKSTLQKVGDVAMGIAANGLERAKGALSALRKAGGKLGEKATAMGSNLKGKIPGFGIGNKAAVELLTQIRDVLNTRLPGKRMKFATGGGKPANVQSSANEATAAASAGAAVGAEAGSGGSGILGSLAGADSSLFGKASDLAGGLASKIGGSKLATGLKGKLGGLSSLGGWKGKLAGGLAGIGGLFGKKEEGPELEGPPKPSLMQSLMRGLGGAAGKLRGGAKEGEVQDIHNIHAQNGEREGGVEQQFAIQRAREADRKANTKVAQADLNPRYKSNKNVIDSMMDAAKGAFSSVIGGLGDLAGLVFGGTGKMLGKGAGLLGRGLMGAGRLAVSGGGMAIRGLAGLGSMIASGSAGAAVSGALSTAGTIAVSAGTMLGGVGGAAMSAAGGLAAFLASPVGLGLAATAAVGYGLYNGYKFLTRNKASPETMVRMMQYGLTPSDKSYYHSIFELESELLEHGIYYSRGQAQIDGKRLDPKKILGIFDVSEDDQNSDEAKGLFAWFDGRFKPVFLTHLTALYAADNKASLADIDKLKKSNLGAFDKYFKAATNTPDVYTVKASPFKDLKELSATAKDVTDAVAAIRNEYKDNLDENGKEKDSLIMGAAKSAFSFMTKNETLDKAVKEGGFKGALAFAARALPGVATAANVLEGGIKLAGKLGVGIKRFVTNAISALENVRFKTYGLKKMNHSHVSAIRNLEFEVSSNITLQADMATFNGDVGNIIKEVGPEFGLSSPADEHAANWMKWFSKRFLPVFLNFMGSGFQLTGKKKADEIEPSLKENQKYDVAVRVSGTNGVWEQDISPWKDEQDLCTNSSDCSDQLQLLKDKAKDEEVAQEKAKSNPTENARKALMNDVTKEPKKPDLLKMFDKNTLQPATEGENAKLNMSTSTGGAGTVTQSKIPMAGGPLANPSEGDQYIKLAKGASIDGLNPEMLRNLKMMAAEYGQLTGKALTINSGFRSYEDQAAEYKKDPSKAAKPGSSLHEFGLALDINSNDLNALDQMGLMRKYGFTRPVGGETWHMEAAGIQKNLYQAKKDPNFASEAIKNSLGFGGGGYGTIASGIKGHRNSQLAASLLDDSATAATTVASATSDKDKATAVLASSNAPKEATPAQTAAAKPQEPPKTLETAKASTAPKPTPTLVASAASNQQYGKLEGFTEAEPGALGKGQDLGSVKPGDIKGIIADAAKQTGADPNTMLAFAAMESGLNPAAKAGSSSATGLFQFTSDTWKEMIQKYGKKYNLDESASPTDPRANALMGGEFMKMNMKSISASKPNPSATDLYIAHLLGASGANKFFKADPSAIAAEVLGDAARANKSIFYDGARPRTIAEVYNLLNNKVHNTAMHYGIQLQPGGGLSTNNIQLAKNEGTAPPRTTGGDIPSLQTQMPPSPAARTTGPKLLPAPSGPVTGINTGVKPTPILTSPSPSLPGVSQAPQMAVQSSNNMSIGTSDKMLTNIDDTLVQSLAVQMRIFESIQQLVQRAGEGGAEQLGVLASGIGQLVEHIGGGNKHPQHQTATAAAAPRAAVSLGRTIR